MSDNQTKGAYVSFEELLKAEQFRIYYAISSSIKHDYDIENKLNQVLKSRNHYIELLRLGNMKEVK